MKRHLAIAAVALSVFATTASATSMLSETASPVDKITQGHGSPGDAATANSDPQVSFRVLPNGKVERTNQRYGTTSVSDPYLDWRKSRDNR